MLTLHPQQTDKAGSTKDKARRMAEGVLDTIYSDLTGPKEVASAGGAKYIMNLVDNHSNMVWIYLFKEKSQARETFTKWQDLVENKRGCKVNRWWGLKQLSRNKGEY